MKWNNNNNKSRKQLLQRINELSIGNLCDILKEVQENFILLYCINCGEINATMKRGAPSYLRTHIVYAYRFQFHTSELCKIFKENKK